MTSLQWVYYAHTLTILSEMWVRGVHMLLRDVCVCVLNVTQTKQKATQETVSL